MLVRKLDKVVETHLCSKFCVVRWLRVAARRTRAHISCVGVQFLQHRSRSKCTQCNGDCFEGLARSKASALESSLAAIDNETRFQTITYASSDNGTTQRALQHGTFRPSQSLLLVVLHAAIFTTSIGSSSSNWMLSQP